MRIIPPLTAVVVTAGLYALVLHRDALFAFAQSDAAPVAREAANTAPTPSATQPTAEQTTAEQTTAEQTTVERVAVVARHSQARPIDNALILRGQTRALRQVDLRAETTSTVISEPLRKGAYVEAGDLLCQLDPGTRPADLLESRARLAEARSKLPEAQARLEQAHAQLHEAEINLKAADKLSQGGFASETQLASAQASERTAHAAIASAEGGLETARAGIESALANIAASEKELEHLELRAPFDGLLESDSAEIGSLLQPGSLCATVIQLDTIKLVGYVPEAEIDRVRLGAQAGARLATGQQVMGQVSFISRSADANTRTFEVEVSVDNADLSIRDGQTAEILISADGTKAHLLPQSALTLSNEGRLGVRTVQADKTAGFIPVTLLRDEATGVWLDGLPEQVDVIVVGQDFIIDGVAVEPTYQELGE